MRVKAPLCLLVYIYDKIADLPVPQYFELFHNNYIVSGRTHYSP
nr:MAG TPA: hypothetical protein [Bacteriophage sp.]